MTFHEAPSASTAGDRVDPVVRRLQGADLDACIRLDEKITGRRRTEYFRLKLRESLADTGIRISLAAECDGALTGFLLARVYYGEFGCLDPVAVLDTLGVHPEFRGKGIGRAMLRQLLTDLRGLNVTTLQTQVHWDDQGLMTFFQRQGFRPAPRLCLDRAVDAPGPDGDEP